MHAGVAAFQKTLIPWFTRTAGAAGLIEEIDEIAHRDGHKSFAVACCHLQLSNLETAKEKLQRAREEYRRWYNELPAAGTADGGGAHILESIQQCDTLLKAVDTNNDDLLNAWRNVTITNLKLDKLSDVSLDPSWLDWSGRQVLRLATGIRDERAFDRLPILADALEEAGCNNAALLQHCRAGIPHGETCWAVERLLAIAGKKRARSAT
jgi:hypothetical protein